MNKMSTDTWLATLATTNAVGQQEVKRPDSQSHQVDTFPINPELPGYLYKISDLSCFEVGKLLKRFPCPLYRKNNHPFHLCNALKSTYSIKLKPLSNATSTSQTTAPNDS